MDLAWPCRDQKTPPTQPGGGADNGNMMSTQERRRKDFADGPVAKTACSSAGGPSSISGQGTRSSTPKLRPRRAK